MKTFKSTKELNRLDCYQGEVVRSSITNDTYVKVGDDFNPIQNASTTRHNPAWLPSDLTMPHWEVTDADDVDHNAWKPFEPKDDIKEFNNTKAILIETKQIADPFTSNYIIIETYRQKKGEIEVEYNITLAYDAVNNIHTFKKFELI